MACVDIMLNPALRRGHGDVRTRRNTEAGKANSAVESGKVLQSRKIVRFAAIAIRSDFW